MVVDYHHSKNRHSVEGPHAALPALFGLGQPASLLDVGCGVGTWTKAAMDLGVRDVLGLDGGMISKDQLLIPERCFRVQDLTQSWSLGRQFDLALCLEVAEHLDSRFSEQFVRNLTQHSTRIVFSAACPGQVGQHHVNCQWPSYWQKLFNSEGFRCEDALRWTIWNDCRIEPWYRQNVFVATRDAKQAGREERLKPVVHPEFLFGPDYQTVKSARFSSMTSIEGGGMTLGWYLRTPVVGLAAKLANRIRTRGKRDSAGPVRAKVSKKPATAQ